MLWAFFMDYRFIKAFISVAKHLNFTKAAGELHITQAAVSRQIRLLEESLNVQLVIRSPQKVMLTPKGQEFYQKGRYFDEWITSEFSKEPIQDIRIGVLQGVLESWLVEKLSKQYKDKEYNFYIHMTSPSAIEELIEKGAIDLALSTQNIQTELLTSQRLFQEKIVLISKSEVDLDKLHEYRWIICESHDYIVKFSKKKSQKLIQVNSPTAQIHMVEAGLGISMVPSHLVANKNKLHIYPIEKYKNEFIYLTTLNYRIIPEHIKSFIEILR